MNINTLRHLSDLTQQKQGYMALTLLGIALLVTIAIGWSMNRPQIQSAAISSDNRAPTGFFSKGEIQITDGTLYTIKLTMTDELTREDATHLWPIIQQLTPRKHSDSSDAYESPQCQKIIDRSPLRGRIQEIEVSGPCPIGQFTQTMAVNTQSGQCDIAYRPYANSTGADVRDDQVPSRLKLGDNPIVLFGNYVVPSEGHHFGT